MHTHTHTHTQNSLTENYLSMVTKRLLLNRKLTVARLCKKYGPDSCTKHFFGVTKSQTFGTITTFLPW